MHFCGSSIFYIELLHINVVAMLEEYCVVTIHDIALLTHRPHEHQEPQAVIQESPALTDLDRRVRSLEQQVQRLRDVAVNRSVPGETKQRNNVWYVLTFAGWMMIPLIVMYMNRYRR